MILRFKNLTFITSFLISVSLLFIQCDSASMSKKVDSENLAESEQLKDSLRNRDSLEKDNLKVQDRKKAYTYQAIKEKEKNIVEGEEKTEEGDYTIAVDVDIEEVTPPLFAKDCITSKAPIVCSNDSLQKFVDNYLEPYQRYLGEWANLHIYINKYGQPKLDSIVGVDCESCREKKIAIDMVSKMPQWTPSMLYGKPTGVMVYFPMYL